MEILGMVEGPNTISFHWIANHKLRHIHPDDREAVKQKIREQVSNIPGFVPFEKSKNSQTKLKKPSEICDVINHKDLEN